MASKRNVPSVDTDSFVPVPSSAARAAVSADSLRDRDA